MKVLYSSGDVHTAIKQILGNPKPNERRVVLVAYVGEDAEAFLPYQKDLTLICCLQPGSTSARSLKRLMKRGTNVLKAERLHMKVYWSELNGCVICSANASKNALGKHGLKEAGVFLPAGTVDIDKLIAKAKPVIVSPADLRQLQRNSDAIHARLGVGLKNKNDSESFLDWIKSPGRTEWKLGWWETANAVPSRAARAKSWAIAGTDAPSDFLNHKRGQIHRSDWLLTFRKPQWDQLKWMYVDAVVSVSPGEKRSYEKLWPMQAIQVNASGKYPNGPFVIDAEFRSVFNKVMKKIGDKQTDSRSSLKPTAALLREIQNRMPNLAL